MKRPTSRLFVPEAAHRKLIAPPIVKKMGVIIKPMSEEALLKNMKKSNVESKVFKTKGKKQRKNIKKIKD